ncbi:DUF4910 domain-containing protein [Chthonobacter albigriseus]|uniref:DUF4910 domain-containing protein n=1 Tax=Chthonobacter albigriseus TaxID=1683161 RepID=UPI001FCE4680|nr:DUF4910 domain-containing protein [Chthonobacter albigriseus]
MYDFLRELFPICRSITGPGLRETIHRIGTRIPLTIHEVPTGTAILDWTVPNEWSIRSATIETLDGRVVMDFADNNLHVVGYSKPVDAVLSREELARHVHTLPDQPTLIPYRTGYFADSFGFCLSHQTWTAMTDEQYRVRIDSTLAPGSMTLGELLLPGSTDKEILLSIHCCHPALANDNLSGIVIATELAKRLAGVSRRHAVRFLFGPGTLGALTWLSWNQDAARKVAAGLVLTCLGDAGPYHYKQSRQGTSATDRAVAQVLADEGEPLTVLPFAPVGYDERQYCSPGFDLPVGCFMRTPNGRYPEYHTSADDPSLVRPESLERSLDILEKIIAVIDRDATYERVDGRGEPQLGRRGLYRLVSGQAGRSTSQEALLWVLNLADGRHSLLDMAARSGLTFQSVAAAADLLLDTQLIREMSQ